MRHKKAVSQIPEKQYKRKPCTLEENYTTLTQIHFQILSCTGSACNSPCVPSKAKRNVSCLRLSKTGQIHADCCLKTARIRKTTKTHGGSNQLNMPTNIQKQKQTSFFVFVLELNHEIKSKLPLSVQERNHHESTWNNTYRPMTLPASESASSYPE